MPRVSTGVPIRTLTVVGRTIGLPFFIDAVPPGWQPVHHRNLRLERHQERAALEGQQGAGAAARPFREREKRIAARSEAAACSMAAIDCSRLLRSIGTKPPI
jgi:hypothetical protein